MNPPFQLGLKVILNLIVSFGFELAREGEGLEMVVVGGERDRQTGKQAGRHRETLKDRGRRK